MKLLKPSWVHHDEKPIFSLDVHHECLKFATGGQGLDSGRVVIWNLLPVLSEEAEQDENVPKILCQMDNHLACVNCVRWSQGGQMLASCSDDKLVMIWRMSKGPSGVFGNSGLQKNPETWRCVATLRGHSGDVLDLAWSPHDRWLASCSIDNTIIIWDVQAFPAMVAMLKGHSGLVKGVTWDPVGKFLASQSDDRSVKIWKTSDWSCSKTITEPFEDCGGTTHILRLSWSPDGQYLVSAHAMNGGGPTAQIIEREGWKCDKDFVGHRKAVTCVRFHNSILKRQASKTQKYCCLAIGSRDRSLSVWLTALQRPLVVVHELFNDSILDLSWGPKKCLLMACSGDGMVACLQFTEAELGEPLSQEEKNVLYQRIYGKSAIMENGSSGGNADMIIENPDLLNVSQEKLQPPALPLTVATQPSPACTAHSATNGFAVVDPPAVSAAAPSTVSSATNSNPSKYISPALGKQQETRDASGKRRVVPLFVPCSGDAESLVVQSSTNATLPTDSGGGGESASASAIAGSSNTQQPKATPFTPVANEEEDIRLDARLAKVAPGTASPVPPPPATVNKEELKGFPYMYRKSNSGLSALQTVPYSASTTGPKFNVTANARSEFQKTALNHRVHVANCSIRTAWGMLSKVTAYSLEMNRIMWHFLVGSPLVNLNFSQNHVMLCSLDGTMRLLHMPTGKAVMPVIALTSAAKQCAFCPLGKLVGVVTECGLVRIWNIEKQCIQLATTCSEVFGKNGPIAQFVITEHGIPMIMFGNGVGYCYAPQMQCWLVCMNPKDPILRYGIKTSLPTEFKKNYYEYPLTSMQGTTHSFVATAPTMSVDMNEDNWQITGKIEYLENQIKLCVAINSPEELKHWHGTLAFHLIADGTENQLRLFFDDLLRGRLRPHEKILTVPKQLLMKNALNMLKNSIKWQRLYMEYQQLYDSCLRLQEREHEILETQQEEQEVAVDDSPSESKELLVTQNTDKDEQDISKEDSTEKPNVQDKPEEVAAESSAPLDTAPLPMETET